MNRKGGIKGIEDSTSCNITMVLPDENATTRQTNQMSDMTLNNVFLSPGIRLSDLDTQRTGASSSSRLPRSRRVGEWVSVPETEDVDIQDAEEQDDDPKRTITALDDDSKRTITVRDSSSPEKVDPSNAAATAGSKRSLGDFEETPSPWLSSSGKTDGGDTTESARSKRSKRSKRSADSEETVTATSRASSSSNGADGSLNTTRAGSKTSGSAVGSGSSASARTPTTQSSQRSSAVPPALDGTSEQRGSSSVGPSSIINTILTTNTTTNKGKGKASIHDLSAASYLARHQAQIAQNHIVISASPQHPAAATASSSSASAPPPSIVLSPPAETSKKKQTLILENRFLQNQLIEQNFQALWTRRENFLRFFTKAHGITLDVTLDAKKKKMNPAEGGAKDNDKNDDDDDDADKRKDSFESSSSPPAKSKPPDFATLLARARERALELLLEAWYEKLGTRATPSDGWTKYNEKTTTSAVLKLRSILATGDTDLRIPIAFLSGPKQVNWKHKLASVRFWFVSVNQAVDFLSAFGIGDSRFGSGVSRVEVLQYSLEDSGGKCLSETHHASERAWKGGLEGWMPNEFPPVRLCPCSEYKLLMKIVGGAQKLPEPGGERAIRWMSERLTREWQKANLAAGVDVARDEWPSEVGERNMPLVLSIGGVPGFGLWHCLGRDVERRMLCRTIRLEGRFAELL
jgi:hypothetical protein